MITEKESIIDSLLVLIRKKLRLLSIGKLLVVKNQLEKNLDKINKRKKRERKL